MKTRTDYLLDGRVQITQNAQGYRAGLDAVMLAAACPARGGDSVLDLGCGAGAASLCLAARVENLRITGIEIQPEQAELAGVNFAQLSSRPSRVAAPSRDPMKVENPNPSWDPGSPCLRHSGRDDSFQIICADLTEYTFAANAFDHIIMNPPYHDAAQHMAPENSARETAFMMPDLSAWIAAARRTVKTHGSLTIIHRADAVMDILANLQSFGAVEIIPLWPRAGVDAERVIVRAIKGRKTPPRIRAGIILHEKDGSETEALRNILRGGDSVV